MLGTIGRREARDLLAAWAALGVAFAAFFAGGWPGVRRGGLTAGLVVTSLLTASVGFLLHELAHKVVAIRFGQRAAFRADYNMLALAVLGALAGFLFAAPGAVVHRGRITARENGLIALAGPATNVALAVAFLPALVLPLGDVGTYGVLINAGLAGFNMLPFGPLDGRTVLRWSKSVFAAAFAVCAGSAAVAVWVLYL
jgi:Zn-dependent protease